MAAVQKATRPDTSKTKNIYVEHRINTSTSSLYLLSAAFDDNPGD